MQSIPIPLQSDPVKKRITALLACHNRREKTVACLRALFSNELPVNFELNAVLVDDGSTDGTGEAVCAEFPQVQVSRGSGYLFWCRGMRQAHDIAALAAPDFLLWLNDDTVLVEGAISSLLRAHQEHWTVNNQQAVIVGATIDAVSGALTYGGLVAKSRLRRFNYTRLPVAATAQACDAMNGNVVLVPKAIYDRVGALDPAFEHAMGDIDYALRCRAGGFGLLVAPGVQGACAGNPLNGTFRDASLPMGIRWKKFIDKKGLPPASWQHFVKRHAGFVWPVYFFYPYMNFALRVMKDRVEFRNDLV